eukprot:2383661-Rhodomonas_salina.3
MGQPATANPSAPYAQSRTWPGFSYNAHAYPFLMHMSIPSTVSAVPSVLLVLSVLSGLLRCAVLTWVTWRALVPGGARAAVHVERKQHCTGVRVVLGVPPVLRGTIVL